MAWGWLFPVFGLVGIVLIGFRIILLVRLIGEELLEFVDLGDRVEVIGTALIEQTIDELGRVVQAQRRQQLQCAATTRWLRQPSGR